MGVFFESSIVFILILEKLIMGEATCLMLSLG